MKTRASTALHVCVLANGHNKTRASTALHVCVLANGHNKTMDKASTKQIERNTAWTNFLMDIKLHNEEFHNL